MASQTANVITGFVAFIFIVITIIAGIISTRLNTLQKNCENRTKACD